jgi:alkyl sulfatase BDS1-like metallo-beta-lactamase superfamily hydrolase
MARALDVTQLFDSIAIRIDGPRAAAHRGLSILCTSPTRTGPT